MKGESGILSLLPLTGFAIPATLEGGMIEAVPQIYFHRERTIGGGSIFSGFSELPSCWSSANSMANKQRMIVFKLVCMIVFF